jgi:hypothetical protein
MSNWFIVTSACNVDYGVYSLEEKFHQTCLTIESIRKYCPGAKIVIIEASPTSLPDDKKYFLHWASDVYIELAGDPKIMSMHKELNTFAIKSPSEAYITGMFLSRQNFIKENDRVFKISGRYVLTDNFDLSQHQEKGKFVFKTKTPCTVYYDVNTKEDLEPVAEFQYKTRLYSFCGSLIPHYAEKCSKMLEFFYEYYDGRFTDLEHVMYRFMEHSLVKEIDMIGVRGSMVDREGTVDE